jgi:hypothetical protein
MKEWALGTLAGLRVTARRSALVGSIALYVIVIGLMMAFNIPLGSALLGGVIVVILHWFSELVHQLGHAWAARRTGFPMMGIRCGTFGVLATSLYPPAEPALPATVHLRRALGGPIFSAWLSAFAFLVVLVTAGSAAAVWEFAAWFFFLDNLLVMTLQVFIPLGFNDGATIWQWVRQR